MWNLKSAAGQAMCKTSIVELGGREDEETEVWTIAECFHNLVHLFFCDSEFGSRQPCVEYFQTSILAGMALTSM